MSTHNLNMSGARSLNLTINDPARTAAYASAKAGDDVIATLSGAREIRLELPVNARIQRREYIRREIVREDGVPKKVDGEYVYEEIPETRLVLVLAGSTSLALRSSNDPETAAEDPPRHEPTPHTEINVRRWTERHYFESGELLGETVVGDVVADEWFAPHTDSSEG